jgi:hypothetical protein
MKIKVTAHIHYNKYSWETEGGFEVFSFKFDDSSDRTYVGEQEIEIEVPDNYDPRAQQIEALKKKKQKVMADFQVTVDQINKQISELQSIEMNEGL